MTTAPLDLRTLSYDELSELRVAAARDVLERIIPGEHITLVTSSYITVDVAAQEPCQACGVGALTLAVIAPHVAGRCSAQPGVTLAAEFRKLFDPRSGVEGDDCRAALQQIFTPDQLGLIEAAFMQDLIGDFADKRFETGAGNYYATNLRRDQDAEFVLEGDDLAYYRQLEVMQRRSRVAKIRLTVEERSGP